MGCTSQLMRRSMDRIWPRLILPNNPKTQNSPLKTNLTLSSQNFGTKIYKIVFQNESKLFCVDTPAPKLFKLKIYPVFFKINPWAPFSCNLSRLLTFINYNNQFSTVFRTSIDKKISYKNKKSSSAICFFLIFECKV